MHASRDVRIPMCRLTWRPSEVAAWPDHGVMVDHVGEAEAAAAAGIPEDRRGIIRVFLSVCEAAARCVSWSMF